MSADGLVVRLQAAIDEIADLEVDRLVGRRMATSSGRKAGRYHLRCVSCDKWTVEGPPEEINPAAEGHVQACGEPTPELRLCQAHRDILDQYLNAAKRPAQLTSDRAHGIHVMEAEAVAEALRQVVVALARGYGVEDGT